MICTKDQFVTLTTAAIERVDDDATRSRRRNCGRARVLSLVYLDQPEGERGVQLDRELGGSRWWAEQDLEAAE